jgi:soluble lytic murein transglycosylase-like protein
VCLALLGMATPSEAQIYSWWDENGTLVLSDKPRPGGAPQTVTAPPPRTSRVRVIQPAAGDRTGAFDDLIVEHARRHDIRPDLVRAVVQVESGFNPRALSPKGAQGLMQLMPATARELGVGNAFDPEENVRGGVQYLRQLLDRYGNDEQLALAAYNAGPGAVDRYGETVPPYAETQRYVTKVSQAAGESLAAVAARIQKATDTTPDGREIPLYPNVTARPSASGR